MLCYVLLKWMWKWNTQCKFIKPSVLIKYIMVGCQMAHALSNTHE